MYRWNFHALATPWMAGDPMNDVASKTEPTRSPPKEGKTGSGVYGDLGVDRPPRLRYNAPMTEAELCSFIAETRATVDAELARLESLDWGAMPPDVHAEMAALRQSYLLNLA